MMIELQILWVALALYAVAGMLAMAGVIWRRRPDRAVLALLVLGLLFNTVTIAMRWQRLDHGPFLTMFEVLTSNVWSLLLVYTLAYWRIPALRATAALVMPIMFVLMAWLLMANPGEANFPPTYEAIWLYAHVFFGKVSLGLLLVAVGIAGLILLRRIGAVRERFATLPDDARMDELAYRFLAFVLVFDTLMLIAGAIWAQGAWGRYWAWDPLETWSFLTWLSVAFALHARRTWKISPQVGALMVLTVFALAFLTFFGVPFVSTAFHRGAV